jgi:hypothetical protein
MATTGLVASLTFSYVPDVRGFLRCDVEWVDLTDGERPVLHWQTDPKAPTWVGQDMVLLGAEQLLPVRRC